jgi:hypothetical protein
VLPFRLFPALVDVVLVCVVLQSQGQPVIAAITAAVCPPPHLDKRRDKCRYVV